MVDPNNLTVFDWKELYDAAVDRELEVEKRLAELEVQNSDLVEILKNYANEDEWEDEHLEDGTIIWYLKKQRVYSHEFAQDVLRKWGHL